MNVNADVLRFLLKRSFGELQLQILWLLQRYSVLTPTILVEEGLFLYARSRAVALASQALKNMEHLGLLRRIARGHYVPTPLGKELAELVKVLNISKGVEGSE